MKKKLKYNPKIAGKVVLVVILLGLVALLVNGIVKSYQSGRITSNSKQLALEIPDGNYQDYLKIQAGVNENRLDEFDLKDYWKYLNFPNPSTPVNVDILNGVASEDGIDFDNNYQYAGKTGYYTGSEGTVTWEVNVAEAGMYCLLIDYYLPKGGGSNAERQIYINGTVPFSNFDTVTFYRLWHDKEETKQDINGNDLKPAQVEIFKERTES